MSRPNHGSRKLFALNQTTPWTTEQPGVPKKILKTPGEINIKERLLYFWLCRKHYTGQGEIVEVGALMGASSVAMGMGLLYNKNVENKDKRIHTFDKFEAYQHQVETVFPAFNISGIQVGDDFSHVYRENIKHLESMIDLQVGDIMETKWSGAPIEILFVDCATEIDISRAIIETFYPYLIPGKSIIIDQDFFFERCWWFAYKSEILADVLEPRYAEDSTLVSYCTGDIGKALARLDFEHITIDDRATAIESFRDRLESPYRQLIDLQLAWMRADNGDIADAETTVNDILAAPLTEQVQYRATVTANHIAVCKSKF